MARPQLFPHWFLTSLHFSAGAQISGQTVPSPRLFSVTAFSTPQMSQLVSGGKGWFEEPCARLMAAAARLRESRPGRGPERIALPRGTRARLALLSPGAREHFLPAKLPAPLTSGF